MTDRRQPLFLANQSYRRRRVMDAAHLLPLLGVLLVVLPLLRDSEAEPAATSSAILYLFGVWFGLVLLSAMFSRLLKEQNLLKEQKEPDPEQGDAP